MQLLPGTFWVWPELKCALKEDCFSGCMDRGTHSLHAEMLQYLNCFGVNHSIKSLCEQHPEHVSLYPKWSQFYYILFTRWLYSRSKCNCEKKKENKNTYKCSLILTSSRKGSASDTLPVAMHWNEAFCPAFTSTSPSREKWGTLSVEGGKHKTHTLIKALHLQHHSIY